MSWVIWALLLILQNASHTWTSRARNSKDIVMHGIASMFSNGVWIVSLYFAVGSMMNGFNWKVVVFYCAFTMLGSIGAHYILMHHVEPRRERKR